MIPATWLLSATRLAAARGDAAMSAHLSQQLGGAEREPPAWLVHEIARRSRLPRPDDPAARAREGGAFLATSRRSSGAASARPVVLHFYSLACRGVGVVVVATIDFLQGQKISSWSAGTESICAPRL
jgi:hypothetical protein